MIYLRRTGQSEERIVSEGRLKKIVQNLGYAEDGGFQICELVEIDNNNNMHFEINHHSIY